MTPRQQRRALIRSAAIAGLLAVLPATASWAQAPNPEYAAQAARLDRGLNGFTGALEAIPTPIRVAVAPVTYDGTSTTYEPNLVLSIKIRGSVSRIGTDLVHEQSILDERVSKSAPVVTIRLAANLQGVETKREYLFPALGTRNDAQARELMSTFRQMADGLVADSMRTHIAIVGAAWQTPDEVLRILLAGLPPGVGIASNTVEEKVAGTTVVRGRRAVVLTNSGTTTLQLGGGTVALTLKGYRLIDVATGLEVESLQGMITSPVVNGRAQPGSPTVTALSRTIQ